MTPTLTNAPLAPLLDRLFEQADKATSPAMAGIPREERERLRPGALIVADNPEYLARVRSPKNGYLSVPFGEDVELSIRLG